MLTGGPGLLVHGRRRRIEERARFRGIEFITSVAELAIDADAAALGKNALDFGASQQSQRSGDALARARATEAWRARAERAHVVARKQEPEQRVRIGRAECRRRGVDRGSSASPHRGIDA